jgi:hypothetical protein
MKIVKRTEPLPKTPGMSFNLGRPLGSAGLGLKNIVLKKDY